MSAPPAQAASRANNFGALRLFCAVLVILSHSFSLSDGERVAEPLSSIYGTLSLGQVGVYGFFLISGYLIVKSAQESQSATAFLWKRLLRIYPGYTVAYLLCIAISPLVGGDLGTLRAGETLAAIVFLFPPEVAGAFANTPHPMLNGSM